MQNRHNLSFLVTPLLFLKNQSIPSKTTYISDLLQTTQGTLIVPTITLQEVHFAVAVRVERAPVVEAEFLEEKIFKTVSMERV